MNKLEAPTKLSEVLQFCPDNDLEAHLRAIKKAFPKAKIDFVEKEISEKNLARARIKSIKAQIPSQPEQTSLF